LFDRRGWTQTALGKLRKLRHWVKRFRWIGDTLKKVFSPHLEKALTFLDDKLLPATSNAVEARESSPSEDCKRCRPDSQ